MQAIGRAGLLVSLAVWAGWANPGNPEGEVDLELRDSSTDHSSAGLTNAASADTEPVDSHKGKGIAKLSGGIALGLLGGYVISVNSHEKCDDFNLTTCSKDGPNATGQIVGVGIVGTGLFLICVGLIELFK